MRIWEQRDRKTLKITRYFFPLLSLLYMNEKSEQACPALQALTKICQATDMAKIARTLSATQKKS